MFDIKIKMVYNSEYIPSFRGNMLKISPYYFIGMSIYKNDN